MFLGRTPESLPALPPIFCNDPKLDNRSGSVIPEGFVVGSPSGSDGGWLHAGGGGSGGGGGSSSGVVGGGTRFLLPRRRSGSFGVSGSGERPRSVGGSGSRSGGIGGDGGGGMEVRARLSLVWRKDVRVDYCLEYKVRKGRVGTEANAIGVEPRPVTDISVFRRR